MKDNVMFGKEEVEVVAELPGLTIVKYKDGSIAGVKPEDITVVKAEEKKPKAKKADKNGA